MVSVISDNIYDDGFTGDDIFEKCGKRHPVLSDINKISGFAGIEEKGKRMNNKSWICQICNKYFYEWNYIKENFHIYCYQPISTL